MPPEFVEKFIRIYKSEPCLWQSKHKDYFNRVKKINAYQRMVKHLKVIDPKATQDTAIKKMNNLRCAYRKEHNKVIESQKCGAGEDEVYKPKLWYYKLFSFLNENKGVPRCSRSNLEGGEDHTNFEESSDIEIKDELEEPEANELVEDGLMAVKDHLRRPHNEEDWSVLFGKTVAAKHRRLSDKEQMLLAEKLIRDVLFQAEWGSLSLYHRITYSPPPPPPVQQGCSQRGCPGGLNLTL